MKSTKPNGKTKPVPPEMALEMMQSAIGYLQLAGIAVQAANTPSGLSLTLPGASYSLLADGKAEFRMGIAVHGGTPTPATNGGTPAPDQDKEQKHMDTQELEFVDSMTTTPDGALSVDVTDGKNFYPFTLRPVRLPDGTVTLTITPGKVESVAAVSRAIETRARVEVEAA